MDSLIPRMQQIKLVIHVVQAVTIFIAWCLTIAYFRNAVASFSNIAWYFALCFLTWPVLIYQTMTSRFPRSRKFANRYAFATIDVVYTILWLSAWAAVAAVNGAGLCIGACSISSGMIALGFFVFLFFGITSAISVYGIFYYRQHGSLPGDRIPNNASMMIDPDREAFSTAPHEEYGPVGGREEEDHHGADHGAYDPTTYGSGYVPPRVQDEVPRPYGGAYAPPHVQDEEPTTYGTGYNRPHVHEEESSYGSHNYQNTGYGGSPEPERVHFPSGNY